MVRARATVAPVAGSAHRLRRGAGVVDRGGLENRCARERTVGSNPTPSATSPRESVLPIWPQPDFSVVFEGYAGEAEH